MSYKTMRIVRFPIVLLILSLLHLAAAAQEVEIITLPGEGYYQWPAGYVPHQSPERPRLVLALSGGGSRGFAHLGVIKALEDSGIPVDGIAGTSSGAVIGGLYAAGYSVSELEEMLNAIDWGNIFQDSPARRSLPLSRKSAESNSLLELQFSGTKPYIPPALSGGQYLSGLLVEKVNRAPYRGEPGFDHLRVRFSAVSTDLNDGRRVLFREGDLSEALLASMTLPLLFSPLQVNDRLLIDGGVNENIPVRAARELGEVVIAVDATMPTRLGQPPYEPWIIANQVTGLMQNEQSRKLLSEADLVISPVPDSLNTFSFTKPQFLVEAGYRATLEKIPAIRAIMNQRSWDLDSSQIQVRHVNFTGADFADDFHLSSAAASALRAGRFPQRREVLRDLESMQNDDRVQTCSARISADTLTFSIQSNPILRSVELSGITQFDPHALLEQLNSDTGRVIDNRLSAGRLEKILKTYRRMGNPLAVISEITLSDNGRLRIKVDEGTIRAVRTEGQHSLNPRRILRDFTLQTGKSLNLDELCLGLEELYGSGLFSIVRATVNAGVVTIKVAESPAPRLKLGAGVDSERHGRGLVELAYAALPGVGGSLTSWVKYAEFDERYTFTYRNLAIFQTYLEGSASLESERTEYPYYDLEGKSSGLYHFDRLGGTIYFGQQFRSWGRMALGLRGERVRTDHQGSPPELDLRRLYLRSEIDTQDRAEFPSNGGRYLFLMESAMAELGSDVSFNRVQMQLSNAQTLSKRFTILTHANGGICDQATPYCEWFRLGGDQSFLGLHEGEKAGRQMVSLEVELREDLISRFLAEAYFSVNANTGAIWEDLAADITARDFLLSLGANFALDTVLGPISITYGHLFPSPVSPDRDLFYFNVGHRF